MEVPRAYAAPIARYGRLADKEAAKYGLTGAQLLAKLLAGESGFKMSAVSSAGARAAAQFMPATRAEFIRLYKVDPWASREDAVHGAAIFMRDRGLAGYNPGGGQEYIDYILGQDVSGVAKSAAAVARSSSSPSAAGVSAGSGELVTEEQRSGLLRGLLWVVLVLGGAALAYVGFSRAVGLRAPNPAKALPAVS